MSKYFIFAMHY